MRKKCLFSVRIKTNILLWFILHICLYATDIPATKTLSVFYFENNSEDKSLNWLSTAIGDMLISDISKVGKINIVSREKSQAIAKEQIFDQSNTNKEDFFKKIGKLLGADCILVGQYLKANETIKIDIGIFNMENAKLIGQAEVNGKFKEILFLEKILTLKIFDLLNVSLDDIDRIKLSQLQSDNLSAVKYNYQGLDSLEKGEKEKAKNLFQKAIEEDKNYKNALFNLSQLNTLTISGESLLQEALSEIDLKNKEIELIDELIIKAKVSGFDFKIGKPQIRAIVGDKEKVSIGIKANITPRIDYVKDFVNTLKPYSDKGNGAKTELEIYNKKLYPKSEKIILFEEVYNLWKSKCDAFFYRIVFIDENKKLLFSTDSIASTAFKSNNCEWLGRNVEDKCLGKSYFSEFGGYQTFSTSQLECNIENVDIKKIGNIKLIKVEITDEEVKDEEREMINN